VGHQLGRLGHCQVGKSSGRPNPLVGDDVSLVDGAPGVPMSHTITPNPSVLLDMNPMWPPSSRFKQHRVGQGRGATFALLAECWVF
jgi:hypothetical protein